MKEKIKNLKNLKIGRILYIVGSCLFPIFVVFNSEYICDGGASNIKDILLSRPWVLMPAIIIVAFVFWIITLFTKRPWVGALVAPLPFMLLSIVAYFKLISTNLPMLPADFAFAGEVGNLVEFVRGLVIPVEMIIGVLLYVLYILFFVVFAKTYTYSIKKKSLIPFSLIIILVTLNLTSVTPYFLGAFGIKAEVYESEMVAYRKYGFLNSFIKNYYRYRMTFMDMPNTLSKEDFYTDEKMQQKPDVVIILSEAFWDAEKLTNVKLNQGVADYYNLLCKEGIYGEMISPSFGGGTVRPEFEVLTGLSSETMPEGSIPYELFKEDKIPSIASYLKDNGYETALIHTYDKTFYSRNVAYPMMGVDNLIDMFDIEKNYTLQGGYVPDEVLGQQILKQLDKNDTPQFIMAITIENHGPYLGKDNKGEVKVKNTKELSKDTVSIVNSFTKSAEHADDMLEMVCEQLRDSDTPTIVLYFGDHLPFLGQNHLAYVEGGFIQTGDELYWTKEDKLKMHRTPFVIWSNKEDMESLNVGDTAPYFLGGMVLEQINAPLTPFYSFLKTFRQAYPVSREWLPPVDDTQNLLYYKLKGYTKLFVK